MIILLRGHIRNAFDNSKLYNCLSKLHQVYGITIYIHTWNIIRSSLSWRTLSEDITEVTPELIYTYFKDLPIAHIIIDDDTKIQHIGITDGLLGDTPIPIKAWKNMWYGKHRIISYMNTLPNQHILNMRFDFFLNWVEINLDDCVFEFVNKYIYSELYNIKFIINVGFGVDNMYLSNLSIMTTLINHFYYNLDTIVIKYSTIRCQEFLVLWENDVLFAQPINQTLNISSQTAKMRLTNDLTPSVNTKLGLTNSLTPQRTPNTKLSLTNSLTPQRTPNAKRSLTNSLTPQRTPNAKLRLTNFITPQRTPNAKLRTGTTYLFK